MPRSACAFALALVACAPPADEVPVEDGSPAAAAPAGPLRALRVETLTDTIPGGSGGISVGADGTVYVADFGTRLSRPTVPGTRVFAVTPAGDVSVHAEGFFGASGNEIVDGVLYQSNIAGGYVARVLPDGTLERYAEEGIQAPVGIASGPDGTLYVADCGDQSIDVVAPDRTVSTLASGAPLACPNGIVRADDGTLYVANFGDGSVVRVGPDGSMDVLATVPGENNGHLILHAGQLVVVGRGDHRIYTVSLDGEVQVLAGSGERGLDDGPPEQATFQFPNDVGISPDGRWLYVNDVADMESDGQSLAPMVVRRIELAGGA